MNAIKLLQQTRQLTLKLCAGLDKEALLKIPAGFNNNLLWNLGHVVVTQQILCYKLSGNKMLIADDLVESLRKATSPSDWASAPDIEQLRKLAIELPQQLEIDYAAGLFSSFEPYATSAGVTLNNIDDAIAFNNFHEGIHVGSMMALKHFL